jgi:hypothetical protein
LVLAHESRDRSTWIVIHKTGKPDIVVNSFDADRMAGKDRAEVNLLVIQTDPAAIGMDRAFGGVLDTGEPPDQALSDLAGTPAAVLALHVQDIVLHLGGKLMGIAIGTPASVGQPLHPAFLVAIEDLVTCLTGDPELPAQFRNGLAG